MQVSGNEGSGQQPAFFVCSDIEKYPHPPTPPHKGEGGHEPEALLAHGPGSALPVLPSPLRAGSKDGPAGRREATTKNLLVNPGQMAAAYLPPCGG